MISKHCVESSNIHHGYSHHALHHDFRFNTRYISEQIAYVKYKHEDSTQDVKEGEKIELPRAGSIEVDQSTHFQACSTARFIDVIACSLLFFFGERRFIVFYFLWFFGFMGVITALLFVLIDHNYYFFLESSTSGFQGSLSLQLQPNWTGARETFLVSSPFAKTPTFHTPRYSPSSRPLGPCPAQRTMMVFGNNY